MVLRQYWVQAGKKGQVPLEIVKKAKGKKVTLLKNCAGDVRSLMLLLKETLGCGGDVYDANGISAISSKDLPVPKASGSSSEVFCIVLQGDLRERIEKFLEEKELIVGRKKNYVAPEKPGDSKTGSTGGASGSTGGGGNICITAEDRNLTGNFKIRGGVINVCQPKYKNTADYNDVLKGKNLFSGSIVGLKTLPYDHPGEEAECYVWHGWWPYCRGKCVAEDPDTSVRDLTHALYDVEGRSLDNNEAEDGYSASNYDHIRALQDMENMICGIGGPSSNNNQTVSSTGNSPNSSNRTNYLPNIKPVHYSSKEAEQIWRNLGMSTDGNLNEIRAYRREIEELKRKKDDRTARLNGMGSAENKREKLRQMLEASALKRERQQMEAGGTPRNEGDNEEDPSFWEPKGKKTKGEVNTDGIGDGTPSSWADRVGSQSPMKRRKEAASTESGPHICSHCGHQFSLKKTLQMHIRRVHVERWGADADYGTANQLTMELKESRRRGRQQRIKEEEEYYYGGNYSGTDGEKEKSPRIIQSVNIPYTDRMPKYQGSKQSNDSSQSNNSSNRPKDNVFIKVTGGSAKPTSIKTKNISIDNAVQSRSNLNNESNSTVVGGNSLLKVAGPNAAVNSQRRYQAEADKYVDQQTLKDEDSRFYSNAISGYTGGYDPWEDYSDDEDLAPEVQQYIKKTNTNMNSFLAVADDRFKNISAAGAAASAAAKSKYAEKSSSSKPETIDATSFPTLPGGGKKKNVSGGPLIKAQNWGSNTSNKSNPSGPGALTNLEKFGPLLSAAMKPSKTKTAKAAAPTRPKAKTVTKTDKKVNSKEVPKSSEITGKPVRDSDGRVLTDEDVLSMVLVKNNEYVNVFGEELSMDNDLVQKAFELIALGKDNGKGLREWKDPFGNVGDFDTASAPDYDPDELIDGIPRHILEESLKESKRAAVDIGNNFSGNSDTEGDFGSGQDDDDDLARAIAESLALEEKSSSKTTTVKTSKSSTGYTNQSPSSPYSPPSRGSRKQTETKPSDPAPEPTFLRAVLSEKALSYLATVSREEFDLFLDDEYTVDPLDCRWLRSMTDRDFDDWKKMPFICCSNSERFKVMIEEVAVESEQIEEELKGSGKDNEEDPWEKAIGDRNVVSYSPELSEENPTPRDDGDFAVRRNYSLPPLLSVLEPSDFPKVSEEVFYSLIYAKNDEEINAYLGDCDEHTMELIFIILEARSEGS